MASPAPQDEMSLVPYSSHESNAIVLRNDSALVVYDENRKQLALRAAPPTSTDVDFPGDCPYCHRPLQMREDYHRGHAGGRRRSSAERREGRAPSSAGPGVDVGFVSPEYFRMLRDHANDAEDLSPPASPRRRLTRPISDTTGGSGSGASSRGSRSPRGLPSGDAEFVSSSPSTASQGISAAAFIPNYFKRFFVEERVLGKGGKGVVLLVRHVLDGVSLGYFACKRVPVGDDHQWLEKVLVEVQLLQHLSHQSLVSYRHVWLEDVKLANFGPSVPCAFILQQYCNAGDLHGYVCSPVPSPTTTDQLKERIRRRSKGKMDQPPIEARGAARRLQFEEVYSFFKGITSGLNHLHQNGFIHRDLKPSNCLLHDTGTEVRVLVSDFGEAQRESMSRRSTGATGTISYCAPEVLRHEYPGGPLGDFTAKSDIFSLGMILYFMCFGRLPYKNANELEEADEDIEQLRDEISAWSGFDDKRKARSDLPDQLYKFLKRLLSLDPADRPSAEDILRGISTGGKDSPPSGTHAHSGIFEEIRSGSRISPIETPPPSTPTGRWSAGAGAAANNTGRRVPPPSSLAFPRPGGSKLRSTSYQDGSTPTSPSSTPPPAPLPSNQPPQDAYSSSIDDSSHDDNEATHYPSKTRQDSSLVLRKKLPASPSSPPHDDHEEEDTQLAPPHWISFPSSLLGTRHSRSNDDRTHRTTTILKSSLLLSKLFSIYHPCSPLASNPWVAYPLLCLAVLDILIAGPGPPQEERRRATIMGKVGRRINVTLLLSVLHVFALVGAARWGVLCLSSDVVTRDHGFF